VLTEKISLSDNKYLRWGWKCQITRPVTVVSVGVQYI